MFIIFMLIGFFKWAGSNQAPEYSNWFYGEPTGGMSLGYPEDCVLTHTRDGESFGWNDVACTGDENLSKLFALCQIDY